MKEGLLKHTDIHLRIRTLIAEAGRETRAATQTIKMKEGPVSEIRDLSSLKVWVSPILRGCPN
jgi:hypothetical protein